MRYPCPISPPLTGSIYLVYYILVLCALVRTGSMLSLYSYSFPTTSLPSVIYIRPSTYHSTFLVHLLLAVVGLELSCLIIDGLNLLALHVQLRKKNENSVT